MLGFVVLFALYRYLHSTPEKTIAFTLARNRDFTFTPLFPLGSPIYILVRTKYNIASFRAQVSCLSKVRYVRDEPAYTTSRCGKGSV